MGTRHAIQEGRDITCFYLKSGLQDVQSAIPAILVSAVEKELELRDVQRQVHFGNPVMHRQVLPQQTPYRLQGVDVYLTPGVLSPPVLYTLVAVAQTSQEAVDLIFIGVHLRFPRYQPGDDGLDRLPPHVRQWDQIDGPIPIHQPQHRQRPRPLQYLQPR